MMVSRRLASALTIAAALTLALGSPADASVVVKDTGTHGDWGTGDYDNAHTGAKCGYSAADNTGTAYLRWINVFAVKAYTSAGVSHQPIKWTATIQRSGDGGGTWKNVASASQTRTASGTASAVYDAIKLNVAGKSGNLYREITTLRWIRNGNVTGLVKVRTVYYSVKWTVGDPAFVWHNACGGAAD